MDSFSEWERIIAGVPQESILGPLNFNIFVNEVFLYIEHSDLCNYSYNSTAYASGKSLSIIIERLKADLSTLINVILWYYVTQIVPGILHVMVQP